MSGGITAGEFALFGAGVFFLVGLLSGVWKFHHIRTSETHSAPVYVDIAHRASLMYAFACVLMERFCYGSALAPNVVWAALMAPMFFFAFTIGTYIWLGARNKTDNQFNEKNFITGFGMWLLIAGEVGGFVVLFGGWVYGGLYPF